MKKKYIFELQLENGDDYISGGYFNRIEGLTKSKNYKKRMKKIRLYEGIFTEHNLSKKIYQDYYVSIILYDLNSNSVTSFDIGYLWDIKTSYNKNFRGLTMEGESIFYNFDITPTIMSLWLERRKEVPRQKDTWLKLSRSQRKEWLGQIYSDMRFDFMNIKIEDKILNIDGNIIDDEISFYFAFGEAVHGAGGYMGSNIHAFEDCLCCDKVKASTLTLIWNDFEVSKKAFYKNDEKLEFKNILDVLNEQGVKLIIKNFTKIKLIDSVYVIVEEVC